MMGKPTANCAFGEDGIDAVHYLQRSYLPGQNQHQGSGVLMEASYIGGSGGFGWIAQTSALFRLAGLGNWDREVLGELVWPGEGMLESFRPVAQAHPVQREDRIVIPARATVFETRQRGLAKIIGRKHAVQSCIEKLIRFFK